MLLSTAPVVIASMACRARDGQAGFVKSPITGELVAVDQMAEHMRISLIDPKWRTQREAMLAKIRETTKASDDEIGRNLVGLARHRPDVFGEQPLQRRTMQRHALYQGRGGQGALSALLQLQDLHA